VLRQGGLAKILYYEKLYGNDDDGRRLGDQHDNPHKKTTSGAFQTDTPCLRMPRCSSFAMQLATIQAMQTNRMRSHYFLFLIFLHSQGGTGSDSTHKPRLASPASISASE
jgi:hypothetical protein